MTTTTTTKTDEIMQRILAAMASPVLSATRDNGLDFRGVDERFHAPLARWYLFGTGPSRFLSAVLKNDLCGALFASHMITIEELFALCRWLRDELPGDASGSADAFAQWQKQGGRLGAVALTRMHELRMAMFSLENKDYLGPDGLARMDEVRSEQLRLRAFIEDHGVFSAMVIDAR